MNARNGEIRKLFSFREVYIGLFICIGIFTLFLYRDMIETNSTFWMGIRYYLPNVGYWFVAIMIVIGLSRIFPYERETGMLELSRTYKHGKTKLIFHKIFTVFIYCFFVVTLLCLLVVFCGSINFIKGTSIHMSQVDGMHDYSSVEKLAQWQFLYEYIYMIFAGFSFGLFVVLISLLVKSTSSVIAICGGLFAAFEFYWRYVSSINLGTLFFYVFHIPLGIMYTYGYNGMLSFITTTLSRMWIMALYIFCTIAINILLIVLIYRRKEKC